MLPNHIIIAAINEAARSNHLKRVGAVIFKGKVILSKGHNYRSRSIKHCLPKFRRHEHSAHAEVIAIQRAKRCLRGTSILVVRLGLSGKLRMSKPCPKCSDYLRYAEVKTAWYINRDDGIERIKL